MTLKDLLNPELYAQVESAINSHNAKETDKLKHVRFVDLSEGQYVSRARFDDTVTELKEQVQQRDTSLNDLNTKLSDLNTKLTAAQADASKLGEAQTALTTLQGKYETDKKAWEDKAAAQAYEFAVKTEAGKLNFSSAAARREFVRGAIDAKFKMDGDTLLGFSDYLARYKADDPTAFAAEKTEPTQPGGEGDPKPGPTIVLPTTQPGAANKGGAFDFHFNTVRPVPKE